MMRSLDTYRGDGPIAAWLTASDTARRSLPLAGDAETPLDPDEMLETGDRPTTTVEDAVLAAESTRRVPTPRIARLAEPLRSAFVLRDIEQLSTAEVARALEISLFSCQDAPRPGPAGLEG